MYSILTYLMQGKIKQVFKIEESLRYTRPKTPSTYVDAKSVNNVYIIDARIEVLSLIAP